MLPVVNGAAKTAQGFPAVAPAAGTAGQGWADTLAALLAGQAAGAACSTDDGAAQAGSFGLEDAIATAVRARVKPGADEVQALLQGQGAAGKADEKPTAAQLQEEIEARFAAATAGTSTGFHLDMAPGVYEKMATDAAFAAKVNSLLDRALNHKWLTEDFDGKVAASVHVNEDGMVMLAVMYAAPQNKDDATALEGMLRSMLEETEDEMYSVMMQTVDPEDTRPYQEILQELAQNYWDSLKDTAAPGLMAG